jgi:thiol-disulfide isomerase/thioredoxin
MIRARAAAVTLSAALLVSACGGTGGTDAATPAATESPLPATGTPAPAASSATEAPTPAVAVPAALRFTARTLEGDSFDGTSLAGEPVVFWFWAPWCPKCHSEAPAVTAAARTFKNVTFVGVASLDTEAAMKEFVQRTKTGSIVHLSDEKGAVWTKLGVSAQSAFIFMKPDGSTTKVAGPLDSGELDGHVRDLLAG